MTNAHGTTTRQLVTRTPSITGAEIAAELVPPRQFADATVESYRPDPAHPSQAEALDAVRRASDRPAKRGLFGRRKAAEDAKPGLYLDGGFGVGKTHLLAALWHRAEEPKYFGTFIEYTALVGALGYAGALRLLRGARLVAIDEFELDDPGDTMMMTRLLGELMDSGTRIAATSNTPPNALGEGRFAAADFLREIHGLAARFTTIRIDGEDYRRRHFEGNAVASSPEQVRARVAGEPEATLDDFDALIRHLSQVHPSRYIKMLVGVSLVGILDVRELRDQADALRFVAFVDRLYDAQIPVVASGRPLDAVFPEAMLAGGYRKKYLRAMSRLIALTSA